MCRRRGVAPSPAGTQYQRVMPPAARSRYTWRERLPETQMDDIYFEDVVPGAMLHAGPYIVPEHELMTFAATWDPLPIHVDKMYAEDHGGLTAPGLYLLAIKLRLGNTLHFQ